MEQPKATLTAVVDLASFQVFHNKNVDDKFSANNMFLE